MKDLHLIVVGKLNDKNIAELERDYFKRLTSPSLTIHEVRAHSENLEKEAKEVSIKLDDLEKSDKLFIVLLTEKGKQFESVEFSNWLNTHSERQKVVFIIGGAAGHGKNIIDRAHFKLSLSELTYPHKLARLLLVEQIYRAQTIKANHPYNK
ncbi:MAG: 23S rRNA (pseudouridine(1915)-N(3))-methyltransferase RlmH [Bacteriovorax sp.]|nr:23S rRNA (pseudouridine(1915)-N(3))-methyltransferase RlmH [Bacteriovorax sp.]